MAALIAEMIDKKTKQKLKKAGYLTAEQITQIANAERVKDELAHMKPIEFKRLMEDAPGAGRLKPGCRKKGARKIQ